MSTQNALEEGVRDIVCSSGVIEGFKKEENKFVVSVKTNSGFHTSLIRLVKGIDPKLFPIGTPIIADIGAKKIGKQYYGVLIRAHNIYREIIADNYPRLEYDSPFLTSDPSAIE